MAIWIVESVIITNKMKHSNNFAARSENYFLRIIFFKLITLLEYGIIPLVVLDGSRLEGMYTIFLSRVLSFTYSLPLTYLLPFIFALL